VIELASDAAIERAAALIRAGEIVAFPTETVYGLGADATNPRAAARIFAVKERPRFDPLIVHIAEAEQLGDVAATLPAAARTLADAHWPGPLTLVLPKRGVIPDIVTAGLATVAVRLPAHPVARQLIRAAGRPIAAPSANPFGYVSPTRAEHVAAQLGARLQLILDGGPCEVGIESTIVSFATDEPTLLRHGAVTQETLEAEIGPLRVAATVVPTAGDPILAPGQLPRHYSPGVPLSIVGSPRDVAPAQRRGAALLSCAPVADVSGFAAVRILSASGDREEAAATLFAALRELDRLRPAHVYAVAVPETGIGRAIMDRLRRAE
jgi:L-threonylcarbamoyladenylate synthase